MQKAISILIYLLLLIQPLLAQDNNTIKKKVIKWPKFYKGQIRSGTKVSGIQVIPFLWDADWLGYVQVGLGNKKISAVPEKPFPAYLQEYINKQYGEDYKKDGVHLLWIVKDLRVNERTHFSSEHAFTRLKADAYISADGSAYRFVIGFDTVLKRGGMDVTAWHGQNMAEAFHLFLKRSLTKGYNAIAGSSLTEMTIGQIEEKERQRLNIPVLTDAVYKEGVYTNFNEFLQNDPSVISFDVDTENKKVKLYALQEANKKELSKPWGLCKGGELYKYEHGNLIPLERAGDGFIISTYLENTNRRNKSIFWGAMLGGVIGAVAANEASSSGQIYTVTAIPYITEKQPEACAIEMTTGELTF